MKHTFYTLHTIIPDFGDVRKLTGYSPFTNLLRNWKKEFLDKASVVFDDTREDNLKEKLALERKEKAEYAKKVGQFTMQVDWLKKI